MIPWVEILIRLTLAAILGAAIGLERERKDWVAGMRTHMLVCLGACLAMIVSAFGFFDVLGHSNIELDPSRVAAQVISGIGFLGAGTIIFLKRPAVVRGLTTAAGLWTVASIGLAIGGGLYFAALIATILALIILWVLQPLEKRIAKKFKLKSVKIVVINRTHALEMVNKVLSHSEINIMNFVIEKMEHNYSVSFKFKSLDKSKLIKFLEELQAETGIKEINWGV